MASLVPEDVGVTARFELAQSTMVFIAMMVATVMLFLRPRKKATGRKK